MEADASTVVQKVALRNDDIPLGEQTVAQVSIVPLVAISSTTVYELFCYVQNVYVKVSSNEGSFVLETGDSSNHTVSNPPALWLYISFAL